MINITYKGNRINFKGESLAIKSKEENPFILTIDTEAMGSSPGDDSVNLWLNENYDYDFKVNWGDGNEDFIDNEDVNSLPTGWNPTRRLTHEYNEPGFYDIEITGTFGGLIMGLQAGAAKLIDIKQWGDPVWNDGWEAFDGCSNLNISATDSPNWENINSLEFAFNICSSLTNINNLLNNCVNLTNMDNTFENCSSIASISSNLFSNCISLETLIFTFGNCSSIESIPTGLFNNNSTIINISFCFMNCTSIESVPIDLITPQNNPNITNFNSTFRNLSSVSGLSPEVWKDWNGGDGPGYEGKGGLSKSGCFTDSSGFSDYSSIPSSWGGGGA